MEAQIGDGRTVVLHVDLDCFYAAVEHVRLGIPIDKPLAVQQWEGLIAVNYAARAAGIVRHDRVNEARKKCPELQLVHVETVGGEEKDGSTAPSRSSSKVSLERYRQASLQVFAIFRRFAAVCERASIDEAYLDVTKEVDELLSKNIDIKHALESLIEKADDGKPVMIIENGSSSPANAFEARLLAGSVIANEIRAAVRNELGYTCSVGIAPNKLLAKIASARNKPDRQTLVMPEAVPDLMQNLPLKKIKLLGGKLGEQLRSKWNCTTAGEAQAISQTALVSCFGERMGTYAWKAVRGMQNDKVEVKQIPKSMLAAKSFTPTSDAVEIRRWLAILAEELSLRLLRDLKQNQRIPRIFQLYYRHGYRDSSDHSKSCSMPHAVIQLLSNIKIPENIRLEYSENLENLKYSEDLDESMGEWPPQESIKSLAKILQDAGYNLYQQLERKSAVNRLALSASGFQNLRVQGVHSIEHFFSAAKDMSTTPPKNTQTQTPTKPSKATEGIMKYLSSKGEKGEVQVVEEKGEVCNKGEDVDINSIDKGEQERIFKSIEQSKSNAGKRVRTGQVSTVSKFFKKC